MTWAGADDPRFTRPAPPRPPDWQPLPAYIWHPSQCTYYEQPRHGYCLFRRSFELGSAVASAELRLLADTRYVLWINGEEVGRGPARSDPRAAMYDPYDVARYLRPGRNVLAVFVLHHGYGTGAQAAILQCLLAHLAIETTAGETVAITTDNAWRTQLSAAHERDVPRLSGRQGPMEVVDLRLWPTGWMTPEFDDADWAAAGQLRPKGFANGPYWNLQPRDIPHLASGEQPAVARHEVGWVAAEAPTAAELGGLRSVAAASASRGAGSQARVVNLDFGRITCGYLELDFQAGEGTVIDVLYAEELWHDQVLTGGNCRVPTDRFVAREGHNEARVWFGWKTFRHAQLWIWGEGELELERTAIRTVGYPLPTVAAPVTERPQADAIWALADHTLRLCMQDGFLDSASREQQQWMGDGERQADAAWHHFGDAALWRRMLRQIPQSQDWMGSMMPRHPGRHENISPIPYFMLAWITSMADYRRLTGDASLLPELWPNAVQTLRWFSPFADPAAGGLLRDVPHWMYIDWGNRPFGPMPDVNRGGVVTALNLKYLAALDAATTLALELGDTAAAEVFRARALALAPAIQRECWDAARGGFADCVVAGELSERRSESANALALAHLPMSAEQQQRVVASVFAVPEDSDIVWVSPAMALEYGRGLAAAGQAVLAIRRLEGRFGAMLDAGATAMWETWGLIEERADGRTPGIASASHGWGAGILGFLATHIAGVQVDDAGPRVAPCLDAYERFDGSVHTRWGRVGVQWQHDGRSGTLRIALPDGLTGSVVPVSPWRLDGPADACGFGEWSVARTIN